MANDLASVNIPQHAADVLLSLRDQLGFARTVHRDLENVVGDPVQVGETIKTRRPSAFVAQDFDENSASEGTAAQDMKYSTVDLTVNQHPEVKLSERDFARTVKGGDRALAEHAENAARAIAEHVEGNLYSLVDSVGPKVAPGGTPTAVDFLVGARTGFSKQRVPFGDRWFHAAPDLADLFLRSDTFHNAGTAGDANNELALIQGRLGARFSFNVFESNIAGTAKAAVATTLNASDDSGDRVGAVSGATAINSAAITIGGLTDGQTIAAGATFKIAGDPVTYMVTGGDTTVASNALTVNISPALRQDAGNGAVVTFDLLSAVEEAAHEVSLAYHSRAFALAMVNLPSNLPGADVSVQVDDQTGLSVRVRRWYDGDTSQLKIAYDAGYGFAVLDPMLAARVIRTS
jgi:hypothetical protein